MGTETKSLQNNRIAYLDYLRVLAMFAIIVPHVSAQYFYDADVYGLDWHLLNIMNGVTRWVVPVFLMISGTLFLGRDIPIKKVYTKYVSRMAVSFLVWSTIYSLFADTNLLGRIVIIIKGHYHLWFVLMMIGVYMLMPLVRPFAENETRLKYYLVLALVFALILPQASTMARDFGNESIINGFDAIDSAVGHMTVKLVLGYVAYFVLGYYISKNEQTKKQRIVIYILSILSYIATIALNSAVALKTGKYCETYYGSFTVNIMLEGLGIFVLFKHLNLKPNKIIQTLSKYGFGVYLVHVLIIINSATKYHKLLL